MPDLIGVVIFWQPVFRGHVDLCLETRLDYVERTCNDTSKATCRSSSEKLQGDADIAAVLVLASPGGELLPKHELKRREGQVAI